MGSEMCIRDSVEGGFTLFDGEQTDIYDAAMRYKASGTPLVVMAGEQYGTGSSRDWAAKGTNLLGVRAVIAQSFERIHRSNLIGMGVLPLEFTGEDGWETLQLTGLESVSIHDIDSLEPQQEVAATIVCGSGESMEVTLRLRIDTSDELEYFKHGGILHLSLIHI